MNINIKFTSYKNKLTKKSKREKKMKFFLWSLKKNQVLWFDSLTPTTFIRINIIPSLFFTLLSSFSWYTNFIVWFERHETRGWVLWYETRWCLRCFYIFYLWNEVKRNIYDEIYDSRLIVHWRSNWIKESLSFDLKAMDIWWWTCVVWCVCGAGTMGNI